MHYEDKLHSYWQAGIYPDEVAKMLLGFFHSYTNAIKESGRDPKFLYPIFETFIDLIKEQLQHPYEFEPYHTRTTEPFNYYQFGLDLFRPLIVFETSKRLGLEYVDQMMQQIKKGENVILLANHQTELEPQAINLLLENTHLKFAQDMIFVAGHRVISDPLAAPFSRGCNLLCIYSKKYLENPPELKPQKLLHNQRTMKRMSQLLTDGGHCIYVAPSGGRDRYDEHGNAVVAPFDAQSIEMFYLLSQQSGKPTHFYPLALSTSQLLPAPNAVEVDLGEKRHTRCTPIHLAFGPEIAMEHLPIDRSSDRKEFRKQRADYIHSLVRDLYTKL